MKLLVLTFYFRPDLCAGSFRATALVDALRLVTPPGSQIDVVTTLPNRYRSFSSQAPETESSPGCTVYRIPVPAHRSGMDQISSFASFALSALRQVSGRHYDIVFATSSRLFTAALGAWIARSTGTPLYLDIRDIFADTMNELLPGKAARLVGPVLSLIERWTVNSAHKVNLVSPGFSGYFTGRYPRQCFSYFTNGIDDEFVAATASGTQVGSGVRDSGALTVLYAGNIGDGQGLHRIVPELAARMGASVRFKVIGDGGRKRALETALSEKGVTSVQLFPPLRREELLEEYRRADVLFLHLNDFQAFRKVLPSKIFEYAALGKPIWAGVSGYAAEFVRGGIANAAVFHPCDVDGALLAFETLRFEETPRPFFVARYQRANISDCLAKDILAVATGEGPS